MLNDDSYDFEKIRANKFSYRPKKKASIYFEKFTDRLSLTEAECCKYKPELSNYILEYHLNIFWYNEKLKIEKQRRILFTILSFVLLIAIPFIPLCISFLDKNIANTQVLSSIPSQITAILTGLLGVQKALSSWLDKRKLVGHFWKASADLKEALYSFENKWKEKDVSELADSFVEDIESGIQAARTIIRKERETFFQMYSLPSVDVMGQLKTAGDSAKNIVGTQNKGKR
jgi:hypothetical protein